MTLSCELSGEGLMAEPKPVPSPQVQACSSFLSPFPSVMKRLETIFPPLFYEVESHTDISLFKQEAFKQFTQAHLQTHQGTGPALIRCTPCMAHNARLSPSTRFCDYKKRCKNKTIASEWLCVHAVNAKWLLSFQGMPASFCREQEAEYFQTEHP